MVNAAKDGVGLGTGSKHDLFSKLTINGFGFTIIVNSGHCVPGLVVAEKIRNAKNDIRELYINPEYLLYGHRFFPLLSCLDIGFVPQYRHAQMKAVKNPHIPLALQLRVLVARLFSFLIFFLFCFFFFFFSQTVIEVVLIYSKYISDLLIALSRSRRLNY